MVTLDKYKPPPPVIQLSEKAWREIEATLGLAEPAPYVRIRIAKYVAWELDDAGVPPPRPAEVRKWLIRVQADAERLAGDLEFDFEGDDDSAQGIAMYRHIGMLEPQRSSLVATLRGLASDTERFRRSVPKDKGGRVIDATRWNIICNLATAYYLTTGKKPTPTTDSEHSPSEPYKGRFFKFVDTVLRHMAPELHKGNQSLGQAIKRALREWRRRVAPKGGQNQAPNH